MTEEKQSAPQKRKLHVAILKQMLTLVTSGFGLVAALAWNSVIQEFVNTNIKPYVSRSGGFVSLLIYAVIITVLAVMVTYQLSKLLERLER